jgi:protein-tyrosine phosphatase
MDDGAQDIKEALEMIDLAIKDGITHIFATPHITDGVYDNETDRIKESLEKFRAHVPDEITLFYGT